MMHRHNRHSGRAATRLLGIGVLVAGCAGNPVPQEPIEYSDDWFRCDGRFDCIAVYDAFCRYTGVNGRYALVYQDWALQQVAALDEIVPCEPVEADRPLAAYCRANRCEYP